MAEVIISAILQQISSSTAEQLQRERGLISGAASRVNELAIKLGAIMAVLEEAEKRQVNEADVRHWLTELRGISFAVADVLDEWDTAVALRSPLGPPARFRCFTGGRVHRLGRRRRISLKIDYLNRRLETISTEKEGYNFAPRRSFRASSELRPPQTTSFDVDMSEVHGRELEKECLVERLLAESIAGIEIVPVVGTGGIGKTALAQLVYRDEEIGKHFELKVWVCVSNPFDEIKIARAIVEALRIDGGEKLLEFEALLKRIHEWIEGRRFLLVLDDVWSEDDRKWGQFENCLKSGGSGSKILVTTRKKEVAIVMRAEDRMICLELLPDEVCWSIFRQQAFFRKDRCERLEEIGRRIAAKSKGLPLVAKTLGSLMRFKDYNVEAWERVLKDELWKSKEVKNKIFVLLLFSYYDLPSLEKLCLLHCAYFPKDCIIDRDKLIQLWVSEGYLNVKPDYKLKGVECFENLVRRSFFQDLERDEDGNIIRCKMHDIIHDFLLFVARDEWLNISINSEKVNEVDGKIFRCTLLVEPGGEIPISVYKRKALRTLSITNLASKNTSISWDSLVALTCLRTLSLDNCEFARVPKRIDRLIHLRYLSLQNAGECVKLPKSLYELINLHTLKLNGRGYEFPKGIEKLVNLRNLYLGNYYRLPKGFGKLTDIETLNSLAVSGEMRTMVLENLKGMNRLKGRLSMWGIGKIEDIEGAKRARLEDKQGISTLELKFNFNDRGKQASLLESLKPNPNLKHLVIEMYDGPTVCPSWMASLTHLKSLCLEGCSKIESFGPFWKLPSLESLSLLFIDKLERVGRDFLGTSSEAVGSSEIIPFPRLKFLKFCYLPKWEVWEGCDCSTRDIMPRLVSLTLEACKRLKPPLPEFLVRTPLKILTIEDCSNLEHLFKGMGKEERMKALVSPN